MPGVLFNRPGLSALAYRSATWHDFRRSLLAALSGSEHPELAGLTTRASDDFSIALLDAVAAVGDVLTFYGERIANESYLRTATERLSVLELARLIGYELKPGVAASTLVAFTVDDAPGAPGVATIDVGLKVQSVPGHDEKPQTFETTEKIEARVEWNAMTPKRTAPQTPTAMSTELWLAGTTTELKRGDVVLLVGPEREASTGDEHWDARSVERALPDFNAGRTHVTLGARLGTDDAGVAPSAAPKAYALRTRAAVFGYNAADWHAMSLEFKRNYLGVAGDLTDDQKKQWPSFIAYPAGKPDAASTSATLDLDAVYPAVSPGGWLVLATPENVELYRITDALASARAEFGMSGKTTRVTLSGERFDQFTDAVRSTTIHAQSEELALAEAPAAPGTSIVTALLLDRDVGPLPKGRTLLLAGRDAATGAEASESVVLDHVESMGGASRLVFTSALAHSYLVDSLAIYGNVTHATQGETVAEVLGGGDASKRYQRLALRQAPLTFVRDSGSATGAASTLALRVNDLLWTEVPWLYGRGPAERVYVTRRDDDGGTAAQFGDGVHGARLPTGQENVRATYRKGVGIGGNVRAGQLTTLLTRPLGLKGAINPQPATGGDDAEPRDGARENAPITVLTLDRVVSLQDYEDFARGYAGIAKALATWSWDGERRGVFLTVAGPDGAAVAADVIELLLGAIRKAGDPFVPLRVASYRPANFVTAFKITVDPAFEKAKVHAALVDTTRARFGFKARAFGQPVAASEVIATLQGVEGVIAVDLDALLRTDFIGGNGLVNPLPAALPPAGSLAGTQAAELLTLSAAPIAPGELP